MNTAEHNISTCRLSLFLNGLVPGRSRTCSRGVFLSYMESSSLAPGPVELEEKHLTTRRGARYPMRSRRCLELCRWVCNFNIVLF